jgi:hypothetical protein
MLNHPSVTERLDGHALRACAGHPRHVTMPHPTPTQTRLTLRCRISIPGMSIPWLVAEANLSSYKIIRPVHSTWPLMVFDGTYFGIYVN